MPSAPRTIPGDILNAIRTRKFSQIAKLFDKSVDFQAWSPVGHWTAADGPTAAKIIEVWYSPGVPPAQILFSHESQTKTAATLECEVSWRLEAEEGTRVLRQVYLLTLKNDKIVAARVYCAGLHSEFPDVDLEKQRRAKGIGGAKPVPAPRAVAPSARAS